jgi:AraC-like DNA-binding protein
MTTRIDYGTGRAALDLQREHTREICDIEPLGPVEHFGADCEVAKVGSTLFILSRSTPVTYTRRPVHVARGGDDHYQILFQLDGLLHGPSGTLSPGDVGILNMNRPNDTELLAPSSAERARVLAWMVPRILLAPLLVDPDSAHGLRFATSVPYTRLLGDCLWSVWTNAPHCSEQEGEAAAYSLLLLLASRLGPAAAAEEAVSRAAHAAQLDAIKHYIDTRLTSAELTVHDITRRFGLSRASLYRLFEPEGGVASYVRSRRLHRAARLLTSTAHRHLRIIDVALESHFASETSFTRSFRREFGLSPADLRASLDAHGIVHPDAARMFAWLRKVEASPPSVTRSGPGRP